MLAQAFLSRYDVHIIEGKRRWLRREDKLDLRCLYPKETAWGPFSLDRVIIKDQPPAPPVAQVPPNNDNDSDDDSLFSKEEDDQQVPKNIETTDDRKPAANDNDTGLPRKRQKTGEDASVSDVSNTSDKSESGSTKLYSNYSASDQTPDSRTDDSDWELLPGAGETDMPLIQYPHFDPPPVNWNSRFANTMNQQQEDSDQEELTKEQQREDEQYKYVDDMSEPVHYPPHIDKQLSEIVSRYEGVCPWDHSSPRSTDIQGEDVSSREDRRLREATKNQPHKEPIGDPHVYLDINSLQTVRNAHRRSMFPSDTSSQGQAVRETLGIQGATEQIRALDISSGCELAYDNDHGQERAHHLKYLGHHEERQVNHVTLPNQDHVHAKILR